MNKFSDGVVNGDLMREAAACVGRMDASEAVTWLRATEDTVGVHVNRQVTPVLADLKERHGLQLTTAQEGVLSRAIVTTAVAAVAAVQSGHHKLWRDAVRGSLLASFDPLLGIRRRIVTVPPPTNTPAGRLKRRTDSGAKASPDGFINATKFGFVDCKPATDGDDPNAKMVLLTSNNPNGTCRHEALYLNDAEALLKSLVDGLAKLGSKAAAAAWPLVCGSDASFDAPDADSSGNGGSSDSTGSPA